MELWRRVVLLFENLHIKCDSIPLYRVSTVLLDRPTLILNRMFRLLSFWVIHTNWKYDFRVELSTVARCLLWIQSNEIVKLIFCTKSICHVLNDVPFRLFLQSSANDRTTVWHAIIEWTQHETENQIKCITITRSISLENENNFDSSFHIALTTTRELSNWFVVEGARSSNNPDWCVPRGTVT